MPVNKEFYPKENPVEYNLYFNLLIELFFSPLLSKTQGNKIFRDASFKYFYYTKLLVYWFLK